MSDIFGVVAALIFLAALLKERSDIVKSKAKRDKRLLIIYALGSILLGYYASTINNSILSAVFFFMAFLVIIEVVYHFMR